MDDSTAHGRVGQAFSGKSCQDRLGHTNLPKASLQKLEYSLSESLDVVQIALGRRKDPVQRMCDSSRVKKKTLAIAMIFESRGNITITELAHRLSVSRQTIYRWPDVIRTLQAR